MRRRFLAAPVISGLLLAVALQSAAQAEVTFEPTVTGVDSGIHDGRFWVQVRGTGPLPRPDGDVYSAFIAALVLDGDGRFFGGYDQIHDGEADTFTECSASGEVPCPSDVPLEVTSLDDGTVVFFFSFPDDVDLTSLEYGAESGRRLETEDSSFESSIFPESGPQPASTQERDPTQPTSSPSDPGETTTSEPTASDEPSDLDTPAPSSTTDEAVSAAATSEDGSSFPTVPLVGGGLVLLLFGVALRFGGPRREPATVGGVPTLGNYDEPDSAKLTPEDLALYRDNPDTILEQADGTAVTAPPASDPDEDWRLALYRKQQVQASLKEAWLAAHAGLGAGLADYADALEDFKEHYQFMMSTTTGLDGIMQSGAEAQEVGRFVDIAFGLLQLGHGGYRAAMTRWWSKPPKVPFGTPGNADNFFGRYLALLNQADQAAMAKLAEEAGVDLATFVARFDHVDDAGKALCSMVAKQRGWVGLGDELAGVLRRILNDPANLDPADVQRLADWADTVPGFWDRLRRACDWFETPGWAGERHQAWETLELLFHEDQIWWLQRTVQAHRRAAATADATPTYRFGGAAGAVDEAVAGAAHGDTLPPPGALHGDTLPPPGARYGDTLPPPGAMHGDTLPPPGLFGETLPPPSMRDSAVLQDLLDTVVVSPGDELATTIRQPGGFLGIADETVTVPPPLRGAGDAPAGIGVGATTVMDDAVDTVRLDTPTLRLYGPRAPVPPDAPRLPRGGTTSSASGPAPTPLDTSTLRGITTVDDAPPRLSFTRSLPTVPHVAGLPNMLVTPPTTAGPVRASDRARANGIDPDMFLAAAPSDGLGAVPHELFGCIARKEGWHLLPIDAAMALENVVCDGRRAVGGDGDAAIDPSNLEQVRTLAGGADLGNWLETAYVECDTGWYFPYSADDAYVCEAALACDGDIDDLRTTLGEVRTAACESLVSLQDSSTVPSPFLTPEQMGGARAGEPLVHTPPSSEREAFLSSFAQQMQSATTAAHVGITAVPDAIWDPDENLEFHFAYWSTDNQVVGSLWAGLSSPFETMAGAYWSGVALGEISHILDNYGDELGDLSTAFNDAVQAVSGLIGALETATAAASPLTTAEADLTAALAELEALYDGASADWQAAHGEELDALRFHVAQKISDTKRALRALEALLERMRQIRVWVDSIRPDGSTLDLVDPNVWGRLVAGLLAVSEAAGETFLGSGTSQAGHGSPPGPMISDDGEVPTDALPRASYPTDGTSSLDSHGEYDPITDSYSDRD